jgi:hypothetical protein
MKTNFFMLLVAVTIVATASCNSNAPKDAENNSSAKTTDQKASSGSATLPQGMENIVGEWELVKTIADNNGDHKIDADEEAKAITNMKDYLTLKANGTCEYTIAKMEGRYEITTTDDGRKKLVMYDKSGAETNRGRYIISVTDKELVINRILSGSDFEVFKRLN